MIDLIRALGCVLLAVGLVLATKRVLLWLEGSRCLDAVLPDVDGEDLDCWTCACGSEIDDGLHCDECGAEPPWGCPCGWCQDRAEREEFESWGGVP